jgi:predicted secreted protein
VNGNVAVRVDALGHIQLPQFSQGVQYLKVANGSLISGPVIVADIPYNPQPDNTAMYSWKFPIPTNVGEALDRLAAASGLKP